MFKRMNKYITPEIESSDEEKDETIAANNNSSKLIK